MIGRQDIGHQVCPNRRRGERSHWAYTPNRTIRSSKPGIAASTAAAKAFPDRGGGGYLGRSLTLALGSELVIDQLAATLPTRACRPTRPKSSGQASTRKPGPRRHRAALTRFAVETTAKSQLRTLALLGTAPIDGAWRPAVRQEFLRSMVRRNSKGLLRP